MVCPEPIDERSREEMKAARSCLIGLAICVLSAVAVVVFLAWSGWWLEALSLMGIVLVFIALRTERGREDPGHVSAG